MRNTRELTWKVFVADGQSSHSIAGPRKTANRGRRRGIRKKICAHRSLSNAYNWIVRAPRKKSSSAVCLHIERTFKYHCGGYSYIYMRTTYICYYILFHAHYIYVYVRVILHLRKLANTVAESGSDEGFFWIIPKGYRDGRVYLWGARNSRTNIQSTKNNMRNTAARVRLDCTTVNWCAV